MLLYLFQVVDKAVDNNRRLDSETLKIGSKLNNEVFWRKNPW